MPTAVERRVEVSLVKFSSKHASVTLLTCNELTFLPALAMSSRTDRSEVRMDFLPDSLPESPLPLFDQWYREAGELHVQPNPDAMVLASVSSDGRPSARVVLCKRIDVEAGF